MFIIKGDFLLLRNEMSCITEWKVSFLCNESQFLLDLFNEKVFMKHSLKLSIFTLNLVLRKITSI
jgi:hypothetical protein